jgi:hypothetical protein
MSARSQLTQRADPAVRAPEETWNHPIGLGHERDGTVVAPPSPGVGG